MNKTVRNPTTPPDTLQTDTVSCGFRHPAPASPFRASADRSCSARARALRGRRRPTPRLAGTVGGAPRAQDHRHPRIGGDSDLRENAFRLRGKSALLLHGGGRPRPARRRSIRTGRDQSAPTPYPATDVAVRLVSYYLESQYYDGRRAGEILHAGERAREWIGRLGRSRRRALFSILFFGVVVHARVHTGSYSSYCVAH